MGVEGRWQVEVLVRRAGQDDARTAFRLQVSATTAEEITSGVGTPAAAPSRGSALQIAGLGLALLGVGLLIYLGRAIGLRSPTGQSLTLVSLAVVGLGIYLIVRPVSQPGVMDYVSMTNPFPPTQDSLAIGEGIYRNQCVVCHGASGRGDGPAAGTLNPPPADFRVHMAAGHTDGELFNWVTNGVPGTAMPAYRDLLTLEERWHAINFIRGFAPVESRSDRTSRGAGGGRAIMRLAGSLLLAIATLACTTSDSSTGRLPPRADADPSVPTSQRRAWTAALPRRGQGQIFRPSVRGNKGTLHLPRRLLPRRTLRLT